MEDALISPTGFMILSGAGLIDAGTGTNAIYQHTTETVDKNACIYKTGTVSKTDTEVTAIFGDGVAIQNGTSGQSTVGTAEKNILIIPLTQKPHIDFNNADNSSIYVMLMDNDDISTEPFYPLPQYFEGNDPTTGDARYGIIVEVDKAITLGASTVNTSFYESGDSSHTYQAKAKTANDKTGNFGLNNEFEAVLVDYYVKRESGAYQIDITPDKFGGNYYLEASTLFRRQDGVDLPAEFIIPNCKVQSNFTFTMASSGDPSSFTFTLDAFPDYTRWDKSKKVLAAIQVIGGDEADVLHRHYTPSTTDAAVHKKEDETIIG